MHTCSLESLYARECCSGKNQLIRYLWEEIGDYMIRHIDSPQLNNCPSQIGLIILYIYIIGQGYETINPATIFWSSSDYFLILIKRRLYLKYRVKVIFKMFAECHRHPPYLINRPHYINISRKIITPGAPWTLLYEVSYKMLSSRLLKNIRFILS